LLTLLTLLVLWAVVVLCAEWSLHKPPSTLYGDESRLN
jgi:hypothetical protein